MVEAPPYLKAVEDAYCIEMPDISMEPRYREGDNPYVNPELRPRRADDVVVQVKYKDRLIGIVGEVMQIKNEAGPDDPNEGLSYAILSCIEKTKFSCHFGENPFPKMVGASKFFIWADSIYERPLINSDGIPILKDDSTPKAMVDVFESEQADGKNKLHSDGNSSNSGH